MSSPGRNTNISSIPMPGANPSDMLAAIAALKAAVESLAGQRGNPSSRAVTFDDLVNFGLLTRGAVASPQGRADLSGGGGGGDVTSVAGHTGAVTLAPADIVGFDTEVDTRTALL